MPKRKDPVERIKEQVNLVIDAEGATAGICPSTCNEFADHTVLKLTSIRYMTSVYCDVMKNNLPRQYRTCAFIDLMAGSGVSRIKGRDLYALGSTLLAARESEQRSGVFGKIFSVEMDEKNAEALAARMEESHPRQLCDVIQERAEDVIDEIMDEVHRMRAHPLVLVDYQGLDGISFDQLSPLLDERADIMVTFIPSNISRSSGFLACAEKIDRFWGSASWQEHLDDQESMVETYRAKLGPHNRVTERVDIKSQRSGFWYAELFSVWRTKSNSKWMNAISSLRELYEGMPEFLQSHLDVLEGKNRTLDYYH